MFSFSKLKAQKSYAKNAMGSSLTRLLPFFYCRQMNPHISLEKIFMMYGLVYIHQEFVKT